MAWHEGLTTEIEDMFAALAVPSVTEKGWWWHRHRDLNILRVTTRAGQTPEQRKAKRQVLEQSRRSYKAAKQREYDARRKAVLAMGEES